MRKVFSLSQILSLVYALKVALYMHRLRNFLKCIFIVTLNIHYKTTYLQVYNILILITLYDKSIQRVSSKIIIIFGNSICLLVDFIFLNPLSYTISNNRWIWCSICFFICRQKYQILTTHATKFMSVLVNNAF